MKTKVIMNMWETPQECLKQMVYIQVKPLPVSGHTMKPLEQLSNNPWFYRKSVLEELITHMFQEGIKEWYSQELRGYPN